MNTIHKDKIILKIYYNNKILQIFLSINKRSIQANSSLLDSIFAPESILE